MNFKIAAFLDLYVGRALLKCVSLLPPFSKNIPKDPTIGNLLMIKFWGFGSIIEATPLCRALKERYPHATMDLLTFSENRQVAESLRLFHKIHVIDLRSGIFNLFRQTLLFILNYRRKYSMIIDLEFFANYTALITKMLAADYTLGFESFFASRTSCYSRTVIFDHSAHIRTIFLKFLNAVCGQASAGIELTPPNVPEASKVLAIEKLPELKNAGIRAAININSSELSLNRQWPLDNYRKLIGLMQKQYENLNIYLVGAKSDLPRVLSFHESLPDKSRVHIAAGKFDIVEFTHALSLMDCLITNDSGPMHIAEAVGTPVVCFFGPETHNLYGPLSKKSLVFYKNLYCSPCLNTYNHKRSGCKDNQCLQLIHAEEVFEKIKNRLFTDTGQQIQNAQNHRYG